MGSLPLKRSAPEVIPPNVGLCEDSCQGRVDVHDVRVVQNRPTVEERKETKY